MEMEGGRRRCITEQAVDLPQRVYRLLLLPAVSSNFPHVDVTQHVKQCLELQREATCCGKSTSSHISSAILLKLTFANMSVGPARPYEQDTRMPINITAQKNFITLLFVRLFPVGRCCCLFAVGRLLVVCLLNVRCEFGLVGCQSRTRMRAVSCVFTPPNTALDNTQKKTTSTGESCEQWR